ncbi:MAG: hypothetical protein IIB44_12085, partial [Candidatus Marinimicrobia bacterium]|nr:hypothetical protein [Candidatus Neomarinimicrobiota bacterium]
GYVQPENPANNDGNNENSEVTEENAFTSYMVLRNNYEGFYDVSNIYGPISEFEAVQVSVAHEFFHSIQFGYDGWEAVWLLEATATWMEDEVFDDVNDNYQYLLPWFQDPKVSLNRDSDLIITGAGYSSGTSRSTWVDIPQFVRYSRRGLNITVIQMISVYRQLTKPFWILAQVSNKPWSKWLSQIYYLHRILYQPLILMRRQKIIEPLASDLALNPRSFYPILLTHFCMIKGVLKKTHPSI